MTVSLLLDNFPNRRNETRSHPGDLRSRLARAAVETTNDAILWVDAEARVVEANAAALATLEYSHEELRSLRIFDLHPHFHPDDWRDHWENLKKAGSYTVESRQRSRSGRIHPVDMSLTYIELDGLELNCAVVRDISDRVDALTRLQESERRFRNLAENVSDLIIRFSPAGIFLDVSGASILGYRPADLIGKHITYILAPELAEAADAIRAELMTSEQPQTHVIRGRTRDGQSRWIEAHFNPRFDATTGKPVEWVAVARNVTDRIEARQQLENEAAVNAAVAAVSKTLIDWTKESALLDRLCRTTREILDVDFSYTIELDPVDKSYGIVAGSERHTENLEVTKGVRVSRKVVEKEVAQIEAGLMVDLDTANDDSPLAEIDRSLGMTRVLHVGLKRGDQIYGIQTAGYRGRREPFSHQQRRILAAIADTASLGLETSRLMHRLEESSVINRYFAGTVSHELRNTFTTIDGYSEILGAELAGIDGETSDMLERINVCAREGLEMLHVALQLTRAQSEGPPLLDLAEIELGELAGELVREVSRSRSSAEVALRADVGTGLSVISDRLKLKMILKNLLNNALKFTRRGSVTLSASSGDERIEIAVRDTGIGIGREELATLFDPFKQAHGEQSLRAGGVGLGLHICKRLADYLGVELSVESRLGEGTTFRIKMPRAVPASIPEL